MGRLISVDSAESRAWSRVLSRQCLFATESRGLLMHSQTTGELETEGDWERPPRASRCRQVATPELLEAVRGLCGSARGLARCSLRDCGAGPALRVRPSCKPASPAVGGGAPQSG